jgi:hypothetical protein
LAQAILAILLVMSVLFVWRAWHRHPGPAALAAALAAALGMLLLRNPLLSLLGLACAAWLIHLASRRTTPHP